MAYLPIRLEALSPPLEGRTWESYTALRIGRMEDSEVHLDDPSISRRHAEIEATPDGWVVRDLGSTNGTFLNGVRVGRADRRLKPRDVLQVGNLVLAVIQAPDFRETRIKTSGSYVRVEATAQVSWEQALIGLTDLSSQRLQPGDHLLSLLRAGQMLCRVESLEELLRSILDDAVAVLDAQHGCVILAHALTGALHLRAIRTAKGRPAAAAQACYSRTLSQRAFETGESLLCQDLARAEFTSAASVQAGTMSSIICALLRSPRKRLGVLHLDRGPFQPPFTPADLHLADALAASVSAAIETIQLIERERLLREEQRERFIQTVTALAQAVELRDEYTGHHTQRVTDYSLLLAQELRLTSEELNYLRIGTPLHDIGKIGIDDVILRKPGKLTAEEFDRMRFHTIKGAAMLEAVPDLAPIIPIVRSHHEHWNGRGYPDGLAEDRIPRLARVVAVADAFDAMTSTRPYRPSLSLDHAFAELERGQGTQFDPTCVRAFLHLRPRIEELLQKHRADIDTRQHQELLGPAALPTPQQTAEIVQQRARAG
jgi:hypothetical protein